MRGRLIWVGLGWIAAAGCTPLTARQAGMREAGWRPPATPEAEVAVQELEAATHDLPEVPRAVVSEALAQIGAPRAGQDCSSFVARVYANAGVELPRTVREQLQCGEPVGWADLEPGDLVFFAFARRPADHVGIYAGQGRIVHVSSSAQSVQVAPLDRAPFAAARVAARRLVGARHDLEAPGAPSRGTGGRS
jgi:cell wall-associated NlpC family hydrolase